MYLEIFLADFAVFRGNTRISRVRDRAKYQKPWPMVNKMVKLHHGKPLHPFLIVLPVKYDRSLKDLQILVK